MSRWCLGLFASAVSRWCLHRLGMCSVAPKLFYVVPDGVCIGWACALWLQRLFYVESKGNVKQFFGLRFGRFGSCLDGVWVFLHLQCPDGICIGWACALWLQRLFYVDSKGNVKQFFGLRFGRFSARV